MAQHELFNIDEMINIPESEYSEQISRFETLGRQQGDAATDQMAAKASHIIRVRARAAGIDLEAEAAAAGIEIDDLIEETDLYFEILSNLAMAYIKGLDNTFPFPVLNE